ncbi:hypothetical protein HBI56_233410 [Parastagonospora nodorum]|nr:hypothetical protein HBH53_075260 [Parastagonospora nodorum]KAH3998776.1 hypothetical protein HBI10_123520 [Parastagonospora nodorum]KAH4008127.1 hypothetical protein HBI13_241470 [Parastagonospora nodorum]KAH4192186.1 hypothetical protein HBI95_208550 [Parastagonospora nodorum]KAH4333567.1 hypothetical protein HBH98_246700 [Parastagonospora nodorum]
MSETSSTTPTVTPGPDHKNCALFDLTMWIFGKAKRTTDKIMTEATAALPLAKKKLEMAERILPVDHPQRKKHIDAVANIEKQLSIGAELVSATAAERISYCGNMPEYATGLFAQYNCDHVIHFLALLNSAFERMREANPGMSADGQFKNLKAIQAHYEEMPTDVLTPRTVWTDVLAKDVKGSDAPAAEK